LDNFRAHSVQVFGQGEQAFCLRANKTKLRQNVEKLLSEGSVPCVIMAADLDILIEQNKMFIK